MAFSTARNVPQGGNLEDENVSDARNGGVQMESLSGKGDLPHYCGRSRGMIRAKESIESRRHGPASGRNLRHPEETSEWVSPAVCGGSLGPRGGFHRGAPGREMACEELLHRAGIQGHAHGSPGGLVAGGVVEIGLAFPLEQVHVRVVEPFAGAGFEDRVERAQFPGRPGPSSGPGTRPSRCGPGWPRAGR